MTIFLDIDGCIAKHTGSMLGCMSGMELLPGTLDKLVEWDRKGYKIILTTGRREGMRKLTEEQLSSYGVFYDTLIMGVGRGPRVIINDLKYESEDLQIEMYNNPDWTPEPMAIAINLIRNEGISEVNI